VRVARSHQSLDDRRRVIVDLLTFIRDFNNLDTTLLIARVYGHDMKFVEAAEAVLQSAIGPWRSIEALRDFAVQALTGEKPLPLNLADQIRPKHRATPFSVPWEMLRALAPNPGQFDVRQLRSLSAAEALNLPSNVIWQMLVPQDQAWLVTTLWGRVLPQTSTSTAIEVVDAGSQRILHQGKLWAVISEAMPCFWWLPPNSALTVRLRDAPENPTTALLAIEGWRYLRG
jgi:hypothetical protein